MNNLATTITAIASLVTAVALLASTLLNARKIKVVDTKVDEVHTEVKDIHTEVKTANSLSIAELADAVETRRIDKIPISDQTKGEKTHLAEVPKVG